MFLLNILHKSRKNGCSVSILFLKCFDVQSIHHRFHKIHVTTCINYSVPTRPNLTPEWTPKADPRFALRSLGVARGPLWVLFSKLASALGPQGVRSESARGPLCVRSWGFALRTHVVTAFKPRLLYTGIPNTLSSSIRKKVHYLVAIGSIYTCGTVKRFHGEHQQNHKNFASYTAKNCYPEGKQIEQFLNQGYNFER